MKGIKYLDLVAIMDFFYNGEASIFQENLDTFLNLAEELNLKGLNGASKYPTEDNEEQLAHQSYKTPDKIPLKPKQKTPTQSLSLSSMWKGRLLHADKGPY